MLGYCNNNMLQVLAKVIFIFMLMQRHQTKASSAAGAETLVGIVGNGFVLLGADSSVSQSIALTASNLDKIAILVDPFPSKDKEKKRSPFSQQTIGAAAAGDAADADRLLSMLTANLAIQEFEASVGCDVEIVSCTDGSVNHFTPAGLSVAGVAQLARYIIAQQLRSANPLRVCLLVAGMSPKEPFDGTAPDDGTFAARQVQLQVESSSSNTQVGVSAAAARRKQPQLVGHSLEPRLFWLDEYGSLQRIQYGAHGYGSNFILSILDQGYRSDLSRDEAVALLKDCFSQLRMRYVINSPQPPCIKCIDADGCEMIH